jgi:uncharacterized protein (TIGR03437 family)
MEGKLHPSWLMLNFPSERAGEAAKSANYGAGFPKRFLKLNLLLLVLVGPMPRILLALPAQVSLPDQTATPGSSLLLPVVLDSKSATISGVQFDVEYDNTAITLIATLGDAAKNAGKLLYEADMAPNRRRFVIVGLNPKLIPNGNLLNLFVNLNGSTSPGPLPLSFSNTAGTDPYGVFVFVAGVDGTVTVQGTIDQTVPIVPGGVLNGASISSGPVAPGEVFTLLGSSIGPVSATVPTGAPSGTALGATRVLFDGVPAPLLYAGPNQINGVTPYALAGNTSTDMRILNGDRLISDLTIPVALSSPAIFTLDANGVGQGAILNQDSTVNSPSNPAIKGTIIILFATGAGQTNPGGVDGQIVVGPPPKPLGSVSVSIGGQDAEVLYAGAAPGLIAGLLQVNARIPANTVSSFTAPILLSVGAIGGAPNVTLAVQ